MVKTKLRHKVGLFLFGLFLTAVLVEGGLRVAEQIYLETQEFRNTVSRSISKKTAGREYRILCLGESTTAFGGENSYPRQLEKILNEKSSAKFIVINKGLPATTTDQIASKLESYLKEYKPDIVTTMIGVNDLSTTPAYQISGDRKDFHLKIVKLFRMLGQHLQHRGQEIRSELEISRDEEARLNKKVDLAPDDFQARFQLGEFYEKAESFNKAEEQFRKILTLPSVPSVFKLGALSALAECYSAQKKYPQAENIYKTLLQTLPAKNTGDRILMYDLLTELYLDAQEPDQAIDTFKQRVALEPTGIPMYMKIAYAFRELKRFDELEAILRNGLTIHPPTTEHYSFLSSELGYCLLENKKYQQAYDVFKDLSMLDPKTRSEIRIDVNYGLRLAAQALNGQTIDNEVDASLSTNYYFPATAINYDQLKSMVLRRGGKLIAIQYPMRPLKPLKEILSSDPRVIFVDNEKLFKDAVAGSEYSQYFVDHFGGDFGHCTAKGNALLARHLAETIMEGLDR